MPTAVVAPPAPGRLGEPVEPAAMQRYLEGLAVWRDQRRAELDELDRQVVAGPDPDALTGDVMLAMALWQSVTARHDELVRVWDDGRAGPVERRQLAATVWGRRATAAGPDGSSSLAVSLPEACRLSDALAGQLRLRLSLDPVAADVADRLRAVRAGVERVRDLARDQPEDPERIRSSAAYDRLARRAADVVERAGRGADVTGLLRSLEVETAQAERDLMMAAGRRRAAERDAALATGLRDRLLERRDEVARLEVQCVASVASPPRLAVPQVEAVGPVPSEPQAVKQYLARLESVERALTQAGEAYAAPLAELSDLRATASAYAIKAGAGPWAEVADLGRHVRDLLAARAVDLPRARAAVAAYRTLVNGIPDSPGGTR